MGRSCLSGHVSDENERTNYGNHLVAGRMTRAALRMLTFPLVLLSHTMFADASGATLNWKQADKEGLSAWQVVVRQMPELGSDAKKYRFNPARSLRQISFDLDGDGQREIFLSATIASFCGSAGCMTFVLRRSAESRWKVVCQTYAHYGSKQGDIRVGDKDASGWRAFAGTTQVRWVKHSDGDVSCEETPLSRR